jgi:hypothetical protein
MTNSEQFKIVAEHISDVLIEQIKSFNLIKADRGVDYVVLKPREDDEYNRYGDVVIFDLPNVGPVKPNSRSVLGVYRSDRGSYIGDPLSIIVEYRYYAYKGFDLSIIDILKKFGASQVDEFEDDPGDEEDYGESLSRIFQLKEEDVDRILKELIDKNDTDAIISIF